MALMYSLEEGALGENTPLPNENGAEFNAYTLTGEYTELFLSLLNYVENNNPKDNKLFLDRMRSHIDRGIAMMFIRFKNSEVLLAKLID